MSDQDTKPSTRDSSSVNVDDQSWFKNHWRPAMAWLYMLICLNDFVIFPWVSMLIPVFVKGAVYIPWMPVTLHEGGFIHITFGAILGITAWTKGQVERINAS